MTLAIAPSPDVLWLCAGVLGFMTAVMAAAWAAQKAAGNSGWIDVFWTFGTGLSAAAAALWPLGAGPWPSERQMLTAGLVLAWSIRLGGYIAVRVARSQEDARYALFRRQWGAAYQSKLFWFVLPQAAASALLCISVGEAARNPAPGLTLFDAAGAAVLALSVLGETLADWQLAAFKARHRAPGGICDTGLWGWSRHPNYFFEWLTWFAFPLIAIDPTGARSWPLASITAAAVMFVVLRFVTGVPPLETTMMASRGAVFDAYRRRVSAFFPLPPRRSSDQMETSR